MIWPVKIVSDMTYKVFGGTLNATLLLRGLHTCRRSSVLRFLCTLSIQLFFHRLLLPPWNSLVEIFLIYTSSVHYCATCKSASAAYIYIYIYIISGSFCIFKLSYLADIAMYGCRAQQYMHILRVSLRDMCVLRSRRDAQTFQLCAWWIRLIRSGSAALRSDVSAMRRPAAGVCVLMNGADDVKRRRRKGKRHRSMSVYTAMHRCRGRMDAGPSGTLADAPFPWGPRRPPS